jgi:chromosome segregation ATPase
VADPTSLVVAALSAPAAIAVVKVYERIQLKRLSISADDHRECREEVAELRGRMEDCAAERMADRTRISTLETTVNDMRAVCNWLKSEMKSMRADIDTDPGQPAE